ncbi:hypothetical protein [Liquorilactobacillus mali]|uniref:hypothetical protein n=1 Tax=Liquorilactobacillus mali TaxID=1618 RepID=UPI002350DBD0|nr:hypothetical protein [Liquorilactobacillus mali]MDC7953227.1 hypothetical protein [Liquorilactobacillus mali]
MENNNQDSFLKLMQSILDELKASKNDEMVSASLSETLSKLNEAYQQYLASSLHKAK